MPKPKFTSADCPECGACFDRLPVEYDEDGTPCIALPVAPCTHAGCGKLLCCDCAQAKCYACDQTVCAEHAVAVVEFGRLEHYCFACAAEIGVLPAPLAPQRETRIAAASGQEVA